jgi:carbamoyl-phosphate synthase large subunit
MVHLKNLNILITGVGAPGVYGVIKGLRINGERKIKIIGVDVDPNVASRYFIDKFYIVPSRASPNFMTSILEIVEKEQVDIIYPVPTAELEMFSEAKKKFKEIGVLVLISDIDGLRIANNKALLYQHLSNQGIDCVPKHFLVNDFNGFLRAVEELGYPSKKVCFKPPFGTGARGLKVLDSDSSNIDTMLARSPDSSVATLEEVSLALKKAHPFPTLLVVEFLPGDEYDVDILAINGTSLSIIPRKNEKMFWGLSMVSHAEKNNQIIELSKCITKALNLSYVINISFKYSDKGNPEILEINPRIPGSIIAAISAGVNMPYLALKLALGESFSLPTIRWGVKMIRYWNEVIISEDGKLLKKYNY